MTPKRTAATAIRCAIYTRKSTEEGLEQEFNSLDAQRESGEAYVRSQAHEGWMCLPDRYDDGGFTGGNMDRPAVRRLMADIEAGKVDLVVCYKVDRLSRSLLDFAKMMETFEKHNVSFVSVTQQFNTSSSMGRLVLNVLLSFAQFEREIISERTRDKIAAARRRGKWSGGHPILGYDVDPHGYKLVINDTEKPVIKAIYELYLEHRSLLPVVRELDRRGWRTKQWTTRKGQARGGHAFTKTSLYKLLTNVAYIGKIRYKTEIHKGEHAAILDEGVWQRVQVLLKKNGANGGARVRNKSNALLKGLVHCTPCGCAMTPTHTAKGNKRYRYYVCSATLKSGRGVCPSRAAPAHELERFVVDRIKCIGRDPGLLAATYAEARADGEASIGQWEAELRVVERELSKVNGELHRLLERPSILSGADKLVDFQDRIRNGEQRAAELRNLIATTQARQIDQGEVDAALGQFDPLWESLSPREQGRILQMLIERVDYNGAAGKVAITFQPCGIRTLALEHGFKETHA